MSDTVKKNLGIVTAYGYARSKGYEGTEEEFAELMASYAEVAEDAAQSASEAAQSATNAAGSATAASGSAVSAANSATSASGSAQDAETAQAAAQQSATAAAGSATSASGSATAASGSAAQAAQSATSAAGSATSAQSYSSTAASAAQAASGSADDADTSATAAAASAAAAAESARTLTIDDTLTQQGQAADSKKTGDEISTLKADVNDNTIKSIYSDNKLVYSSLTYTGTQSTTKHIYGDVYLENGKTYIFRLWRTNSFVNLTSSKLTIENNGTEVATIFSYTAVSANGQEFSWAYPTGWYTLHLLAAGAYAQPPDVIAQGIMVYEKYQSVTAYSQGVITLTAKSAMTLNNKTESELLTIYKRITVGDFSTVRGYAYIYQNDGIYFVNADSTVWIALQAYDSPTYDGTRTYDSGKLYGKQHFTINSAVTGYYYRVVFGIDSGSFTDEQKNSMIVGLEKTIESAINDLYSNIEESDSMNSGVITIQHGATVSYPANTLTLYKTAFRNGLKYWECDVRPCLDDYVLCHDDDIYNHALTADGQTITQGAVIISENTVATLQTYKFGVITNKQADGLVSGFEDDTIPTLRQFLKLAKAYGAIPVIEIKFAPTLSQMEDIFSIINSFGMIKDCYILGYQSVDTVIPYACQLGAKKLSIIINNGECTTGAVDTAYGYISQYLNQLDDVFFSPMGTKYDASVGLYANGKGMRINVWTILSTTTDSAIRTHFNNGVTGFTSDAKNVSKMIMNDYL